MSESYCKLKCYTHAVFSSEDDPTATVAVGRSERSPEDQVAVIESLLAVAGLGTSLPAPNLE